MGGYEDLKSNGAKHHSLTWEVGEMKFHLIKTAKSDSVCA